MDLNVVVMNLGLGVGLVALIAAALALSGQRRDSERQVLREKTVRQREISRCLGEAIVLQAQVRLRIESLMREYVHLRHKVAVLRAKCSDPADSEQLAQLALRIEARLQRLQQNYDDAQDSLSRLTDKSFVVGKKWSDLEALIETARALVLAADVGGVKDILGDLEGEIAKFEQKSPQAAA